jgi:prepilin peptidase CpaA
MTHSIVLAHTVLMITAAVLSYAAWTDLRHYKIPNELIIILTGLFIIHAFLSGRWVEMYWNFATAFIAFLVLLVFYMREGMGGGDIKLLSVGFLWVGYTCILPFALFLFVFAVIHTIIAKLGWVKTPDANRKRIPFAPTIAAALIGTFMLGCLDQPRASSVVMQRSGNSVNVSPPLSR